MKINFEFPVKYHFLNDTRKMYEYYSNLKEDKNLLSDNTINKCFEPFVNFLEDNGFKKRLNHFKYVETTYYQNKLENKPVAILGFSGGKDSVVSALKLSKKYKVILYYLEGINKSYPNEKDIAIKCSIKLNLPLIIQKVNQSGDTIFKENPIKNMLIYACMVNYGLEQGITKYYFGNAKNDTVSKSNFDRDFSDSLEMFEIYTQCLSNEIGVKLENEPLYDNFYDNVLEIAKRKDLRDYVCSCLTPNRFQKYLHNTNQKKYNITLPAHNCGSCWKCCVEYIIYVDSKNELPDKRFYMHCMDVLKNKMLEENQYLKNNKYNLKDVYITFINKELWEESLCKYLLESQEAKTSKK